VQPDLPDLPDQRDQRDLEVKLAPPGLPDLQVDH
jgi:hypothetical protein